MVIILFQPIGCRMFFPYPMEEFTNQNIGIDLLDNTCLVELEEKINETSDNYQIVRLIEEYLLNRLCKNIPCNANRIITTVQNINEGEGNISCLLYTSSLKLDVSIVFYISSIMSVHAQNLIMQK